MNCDSCINTSVEDTSGSAPVPGAGLAEEGPVALARTGPVVQLAERLGLARSEVTASQAVRLDGANSLRADVIVLALTLSSIRVLLQVSPDNENWTTAASFSRRTIGYSTVRVPGVAFRFARLYYLGSDTVGGVGVLTAKLRQWRA
ncbi:MAG: hypothetical protein HYY18_01125 [Planctomycetes bacterium]|nr:hypothetical protein [Planctomycetota bacterium]